MNKENIDHLAQFKDFISHPEFRPLFKTHPIRIETMTDLVEYVEKGRPLGHFLTAILQGDLFEAFGRADEYDKLAIPAIVQWVVKVLPIGCYGSPTKMKAWYNERHN